MTVYSGKQIEGGFEFIWDKVRTHRTNDRTFRISSKSPGKPLKMAEQIFSFHHGIQQYETHCKQSSLETFLD